MLLRTDVVNSNVQWLEIVVLDPMCTKVLEAEQLDKSRMCSLYVVTTTEQGRFLDTIRNTSLLEDAAPVNWLQAQYKQPCSSV